MAEKKYFIIGILSIAVFLALILIIFLPAIATETTFLNNVDNDFQIDGFTSIWFNTSSDQRDISVRFDSSVQRIITGVRTHYRTARLLEPYGDCNVTYKFESGPDWIDYDDVIPNTAGDNRTHEFHCQGDTFLVTSSFFYISMGCGSDDPYLQIGTDNDRSGHSEYSLNGGGWTADPSCEYLVEALVENVTDLTENQNQPGVITHDDDFVDAWRVSLTLNDDVHFNLWSSQSGEYFNLRMFAGNIKLTSDGNAIWLEEGASAQKAHHYVPTSTGNFVVLVEPNTDEMDNGTYFLNWTSNPDPPAVTVLPGTDNDGNVSLIWSAPVDTDINYYNVYRSKESSFSLDATHRITPPGTVITQSYNDTFLTNGTYYYVITSVDNTGHESNGSNLVSTTVEDVTKPESPIFAVPDSYPIDNDGLIQLNWTFANLNDVNSCSIYRSPLPGFELNTSTFLQNVQKSNTLWIDQVFSNGTYYYKAVAIDINGLASLPTAEVNTTYLDVTVPTIPGNFHTSLSGINGIWLTWDHCLDSDFAYYQIYRSTQYITTSHLSTLMPITTTTNNYWTDQGLPSGIYYYIVIAVDINGLESPISPCLTAVVPQTLDPNLLNLIFGAILLVLTIIIISGVVSSSLVLYKKRSDKWIWEEQIIQEKFSKAGYFIKAKLRSLKQGISVEMNKVGKFLGYKLIKKSGSKVLDEEEILSKLQQMNREEILETIKNYQLDMVQIKNENYEINQSLDAWIKFLMDNPEVQVPIENLKELSSEIIKWETFFTNNSLK
ncbi:MAG: fibronectin type III domain-containing protein [Candidatus Helarchaeota archaeon]